MVTPPTRGARDHRRWLCLLLAFGLIAAGCGNSGDGDTAAGTGEPAEETEDSDGDAPAADGDVQPIDGVPGVTDDEISFSVVGTVSNNPLGTCHMECYVHGIEAYFAYRNSEGGAHGRDLVVGDVVDDELSNNQVKMLEVLEDGDSFGIFSHPFVASGFADVAAAGVPLYTSVIFAPDTAGQESSFGAGGVACLSCPAEYYAWVADQAGASTTASLGYGVSQPSKECTASSRSAIDQFGGDLGIESSYFQDDLPYGLPNGIAPEVTAMKSAGVDLVFTCLDMNAVSTLSQEMERQGMGDVPILLPSNGYGTPGFLEQNGDLFDGDLVLLTFRPFESDHEGTGLETFLEWMEETGHGEDSDLWYALYGWINADLAYQGIVDAGPQFDQAKVVAATNELEDYTADGIHPPIDVGRQHVAPTPEDPVTHGADPRCASFVRIVDGEYELLGVDAEQPWVCWELEAEGYEEPTLTDFE